MYLILKNIFLKLLKYTGVIKLVQYYNKNNIPVLCYHGISLSDEHQFMPSNFMPFDVFKERILWLKSNDYHFLELNDALKNLKNNTVKNKSVVITIDDGFESCFEQMVPFLIEQNIPATFYITTYYARKNYPIFRLSIQYLAWKFNKDINLDCLAYTNDSFFRNKSISNLNLEELWIFIKHCEDNYTSEENNEIINKLTVYNHIHLTESNLKTFSLMNPIELKKTTNELIDYQLHTHTHECNNDPFEFKKDLIKNIQILNEVNKKKLIHFCYPSGIWDESYFKTLETLSIKTATTCDTGLVSPNFHPYKIPRLIDSSNMTLIQFEAEIAGVGCLLRKIKA